MRSIGATMFSRCNNIIAALSKEHWITTSVLLWSALVIALALAYVTIGIRWYVAWIIIGGIVTAAAFLYRKNIEVPPLLSGDRLSNVLHLVSIFFSLSALALLIAGRTNDPLRSPWEIVPLWFFLIVAFSVGAQIGAVARERAISLLSLASLVAQFAVAYGAAVAAFRFGYAYDPIIHQTAEQYVAEHGRITPLQPFYIGQYALVAALHFVSSAPVWIIDRLLVPVLATVVMPIAAFVGLYRGWGLSERRARLGALALTALPVAEFTFTVPHNLTVLYAAWWVMLVPLFLRSRAGVAALLALSGAAAVTHPLVGVPLIIATLVAVVVGNRATLRWPFVALGSVSIGTSTLIMLGIFRLLHGEQFLAASSPFEYVENFISIFSFVGAAHRVRPLLQLLYGFSYLLPFVFIATGAWATVRARSEQTAHRALLTLLGGIFFAIFLISTLISIPNVATHEQNEFVLRLRYLLPLLVLPPAIALGATWFAAERSRMMRMGALCGLLLSIVTALYITYPRTDGVLRPGWNVSHSDIEAVRGIEHAAAGRPYVVLTNQIMSAAGLREVGFEQRVAGMHTYPISLAEPHHELTQKILYDSFDAAAVHALAQRMSGTVFVAVHDYWYRAPQLLREIVAAKPIATHTFGHVFVFEFDE